MHAFNQLIMRYHSFYLRLLGASLVAAGEASVAVRAYAETIQPARSAFIHPDTEPDAAWSALLIGVAEPAQPNQWIAFRRSFQLERQPARASARIAVDSKYWLWCNGKPVVREGGLKRGPTPTDTYFDEIDLAPYLQPGRNTIAVLVWYFGKEGFSHKDSGQSGLVFQLDTPEHAFQLKSDSCWKARLHPAFGGTEAPHPNYRLPESNIRYDASRELVGWTTADYDDSAWPKAVEFGRVPCAPWNRLVRRPIPFWFESGLLDYIGQRSDLPSIEAADESLAEVSTGKLDPAAIPGASTPKSQVWIAKLPYNAQVTPYLEVDSPAGLRIGIQMDDYEGGGANNVRAEYITREGRQEFECFGWMNGHEVRYTIPDAVRVLRLRYRESGFATAPVGTFHCDDPFFNRLRAKAARTLYLTMRDTFMDCPDRERAQWWGDVVNELGEVFYAFDRRADTLTRKAILELVGWQKPDGVLFSPVPAGNWDRDLPLQMLASIGRQGFWTYAFYSGDFETLRAAYPGMKRYLEIWDLQPDGLIRPRPGSWPWGDWGENVDMTLLANIWYHLALQGQLNTAKALGYENDLPWIEARLRSIERAFSPSFWTGNEFRSPHYKGATDDRANALAVVAGLAHRDQYSQLRSVFLKEEHASPYMEKYVLEALCLMGEPALAQDRMKRRYKKMVDHPEYTTLWEGWGIGKEGFGGGTINHAWSGGPLTIMSQYFAGIAPTQPGFAAYHVYPQLGALREIDASVNTRQGTVEVSIRRNPRVLTLNLNSPDKTVANVGLPAGCDEQITRVQLNGEVVWEAGKIGAKIRGVRNLGFNGDQRLCFEVPAGQWSFTADLAPKESPRHDR
jgi:hypothetical protein